MMHVWCTLCSSQNETGPAAHVIQCGAHALLLRSKHSREVLLGAALHGPESYAPVRCAVPETREGVHHEIYQLHCRAACSRDQLGCAAAIPVQQYAAHLYRDTGDHCHSQAPNGGLKF